jgi:prophage regulatory protein
MKYDFLLRLPAVLKRTGESRSGHYKRISDGTFTPPIKIGLRSSAWPDCEVSAINSARVAGKSDSEIRALVADLVAQRKEATC